MVLDPLVEPDLRNRERHSEFDAASPWRRSLLPGVTAVLRVKSEARNLPWVLPGLLRSTDALVMVDNQSVDGSAEVAREVASRHGFADRLRVVAYPFDVSRCGPEHLRTPPDSVHSLAYFNNWAFSHVRTAVALKWDGDMVLTPDGEILLSDFGWQVGGRRSVVLKMPRHPVYVESDQVAYVDLGLSNVEHYGHSISSQFSQVKGFEWELLNYPPTAVHLRLPGGAAVELKHLDSDEFANWTDVSAFATSRRTGRKRREYEVFRALGDGRWQSLPGVHRVEAPKGEHVVDHIVRDWLPSAPRPLVRDVLGAAR
jgi:hypothetical protein